MNDWIIVVIGAGLILAVLVLIYRRLPPGRGGVGRTFAGAPDSPDVLTNMADETFRGAAVCLQLGDFDGAEAGFRKAAALREGLGDWSGAASAHGMLGGALASRGDIAAAEKAHRRSMRLYRRVNDREGEADGYANLGALFDSRNDMTKAAGMYQRAIRLYQEIGSPSGLAAVYGNLGLISSEQGQTGIACAFWRDARRLYREAGNHDMADQVAAWMNDAGCGTE